MLLVISGFLGGRGWSGRVIWGASFLLIATGLVVIAAGPVYGTVSSSQLGDLREETVQKLESEVDQNFQSTSRLALDKGFDMAESIADDFMNGIRDSAVALAVIAIIAIAASMFWNAIVAMVASMTSDIGKKDR